MVSSVSILVALAAVVVSASANAVPASDDKYYLQGTPNFNYDCTGKEDGDYAHPSKCDHFVACVAGTEAYEMPCQMGENGRLHWVLTSGPSRETSKCDRPEVAGCAGRGGETTEAPKPTEPAATDAPPADGEDCDPDKCWLRGNCRDYEVCNKETKKWEKRNCGTDLFWNEAANSGSIHGGNCDFFQNLDQDHQDKYKGDENCILPCAWWQNAEDACTGRYQYRVPFDNVTLLNREKNLECPSSNGEQLVWVQSSLSCERASEAKDAAGNSCASSP